MHPQTQKQLEQLKPLLKGLDYPGDEGSGSFKPFACEAITDDFCVSIQAIEDRALRSINIDDFWQKWEHQVSQESKALFQQFMKLLKNELIDLQAFEFFNDNYRHIYTFLVAQDNEGNWLGFAPSIRQFSRKKPEIKFSSTNLEQQIEVLLSEISFVIPESYSKVTSIIYEKHSNKYLLIDTVLKSANCMEERNFYSLDPDFEEYRVQLLDKKRMKSYRDEIASDPSSEYNDPDLWWTQYEIEGYDNNEDLDFDYESKACEDFLFNNLENVGEYILGSEEISAEHHIYIVGRNEFNDYVGIRTTVVWT